MSVNGDNSKLPGSAQPAADVPEFTVLPGQMAMPVSALQNDVHLQQAQLNPNDTVLQGRYRIVGTLGHGGFGAVYRVMDLRLPGKCWALKELHFRDKSQLAEAKRNFEREARMLSTLMHRSLPVIVDYFTEGSSTYLLMEEVDGCNLAQLVENEGVPRELDALRWALELARVMDYLHTQDPPVIFRDLKPENIMITGDRHVKLIDFGLARFFDPGKKRDTSVVGSVGYAPPEVWEDASQTDARSDIYSFGATMYFVLTGRPPSPVYGTHRLEPYCPNLNPRFAALVLRCMETKPEDRYPSAADIIKDLISILAELSSADPLLKEELRAESFYRTATQSVSQPSKPVAVASVQGHRHKTESSRAHATPKWAPLLLLTATLLFFWGAFLGYREASSDVLWEFDTPYELKNPDKETARAFINNKDWAKANVFLDQAVTRHPIDAEAHILRQNVQVMMAGKPAFHVPAFMTISGLDAPEGYRLLYGVAMAQADFNKDGAKDGRRVVIDIFDDKSNTEVSQQIADNLSKNPEYTAVIGPFSSQRTLAMAFIFRDAHLPIVAPVVSAPGIWDEGPYIFTASDTNLPRCRAVAKHFKESGCNRVAILVDQDSVLSSNVADYFRDSFVALGGEVALDTTFSDVKFAKAIEAIVENKADCVFFSDYRGTPLALFAKELRSRGLKMPLGSQVAPFTKDLVEVGGSDVEGLVLAGYFHPDGKDQLTRAYTERFRRNFGDLSPSHLDASAYDAANLIFGAYKEGIYDREGIEEYLSSIGAEGGRPLYRGATGRFALARKLDCRDVYLIKINNGRYKLVKTLPEGK